MSAVTAHPAPSAAPAIAEALRVESVCKTIDDRPILHDINLDVPPGQYLALLGANGAGKSTLLKVISTLMPPTSGKVFIFGQPMGRDAAKLRAKIGLIGHQAMLYRDLSARENLEFFGKLYGVESVERRAAHLLEVMGLSPRAEDPIKAFSRGMTQRVAIARALMHSPQLLLADEPFAGLDAPSIAAMESILAQLHKAGKTIVLVNHDIGQSLQLAQRAVVMRDGAIITDQPCDRLDRAQVLAEVSEA